MTAYYEQGPLPAGSGLDSQQTLTQLIEIATRVLAMARPVCFRLAATEVDREKCYQLRYTTVIDRGWAQPDDLPSGLERDEFDSDALHVMGFDEDKLIACARLVFPVHGRRLPTEALFNVEIQPQGKVADLSRQIVTRDYTSLQHGVFGALLAYSWLQAQERGYYYVCGDFTPAVIRLYKRMGMSVSPLGPPRIYWGEERIPILQDVLKDVSNLSNRWLGDK